MWRALRVSRAMDDATAPVGVDLVPDLTDAVLMPGDVTVDVDYSSINYKDGLALMGRPGIIRPASLIPGIDLVGVVAESDSPDWTPGDRVLVNGCGLGETHHGGLAERARVSSEWLVAVPSAMTQSQAAAIGSAGFTAMLAVLELERAGVAGDILVTGASGGVGSIAIALLSGLGHTVTASTGRAGERDYLRSLGAAEIIDRAELSTPGKPLQSQRWAGAIDSVGGDTLAGVLSRLEYGGAVAACGNAGSSTVTASMMPFILRAVTLVGVNSTFTPRSTRLLAWRRLEAGLDLALLDSVTETITLGDAVATAERIVEGRVRGRTVVDVRA
ncbi:MAG: oxidoreductase [Microbacteriaceae bacterium]|nr:oxidoreductase [Microbacteriaceae bacterium]